MKYLNTYSIVVPEFEWNRVGLKRHKLLEEDFRWEWLEHWLINVHMRSLGKKDNEASNCENLLVQSVTTKSHGFREILLGYIPVRNQIQSTSQIMFFY
jgi:hypothetical protein